MNKGLIKIRLFHKESIIDYNNNPNKCSNCNKEILCLSNKLSEVINKRFCNRSCSVSYNNRFKIKEKIAKTSTRISIENYTKRDLQLKRSSWWAARTPIAKHARKIYNKSSKPKECSVCGYNKHYHVAHITPVSKFNDNITIKEINNINNLIALCPNHHWEYDNNQLIIAGGRSVSSEPH